MRLTLQYLKNRSIISEDAMHVISDKYEQQPMSVFWHLKSMLYVGILMLTGGLGIILYQNIDSIGHVTIVIFTALLMTGTIGWCFYKYPAFSWKKTDADSPWADYVLMLGTLTMLVLVGYLQYQFNVFGTRYGLATFIPTAALFFLAYRFDHVGVLTLAIVGFATWIGINIGPRDILNNDFSNWEVVQAGITVSASCFAIGYLGILKNLKSHFSHTYYNVAYHVYSITLLAGAASFPYTWLWLLALLGGVLLCLRYAQSIHSFYFALVSIACGYIAVSWLFILIVGETSELSVYLYMIFFIASALGFIKLLKMLYLKMKQP